MPGFSITDVPAQWNQALAVRTFGTANPVFKLTNGANEVLFVKFMKPGEATRSMFATSVVSATGLRSYQSRVVKNPSTEATQITSRIQAIVGQNPAAAGHADVRDSLEAALGAGAPALTEILIMADVNPNQNLVSFTDRFVALNHQILQEITRPQFIQNLGKMIAADVIVGNYDRVSYVHSYYEQMHPGGAITGSHSGLKFHGGNFFVDPATMEIVPIDNDAVLFELKPTPAGLSRKAEWLQLLVQGGLLAYEEHSTVTVMDYPSLDKILDPAISMATVERIVGNFFHAQIQHTGTNLNGFYQQVAVEIASAVRTIIANLKGVHGLNRRLKDLLRGRVGLEREAFSYEAFKLKTRYAEFLTNPGHAVAPAVALQNTEYYMRYREWKERLYAIPNLSFDPSLPAHVVVRPPELNKMQKAARAATHTVSTFKSLGRTTEISEAKRLKADLRADALSGHPDAAKLREVLGHNVNQNDRRWDKLRFEAALQLTVLNMEEQCNLLDQMMELVHRMPTDAIALPLCYKSLSKFFAVRRPIIDHVVQRYLDYSKGLSLQVIEDKHRVLARLNRARGQLEESWKSVRSAHDGL